MLSSNIIYHGTTTKNNQHETLKNIRQIDINKGRQRTDFGQGFYLTSIFTQAVRWGEKQADYMNHYYRYNNVYPVVINYEIDLDRLRLLRGIHFDKQDLRWSEFIFNNRVRSDDLVISEFHNRNKNFDYIIGNVGDGMIVQLMRQYEYDEIDSDIFLKGISSDSPNHQISLHTQKAINCLTYRRIIRDDCYSYKRR